MWAYNDQFIFQIETERFSVKKCRFNKLDSIHLDHCHAHGIGNQELIYLQVEILYYHIEPTVITKSFIFLLSSKI